MSSQGRVHDRTILDALEAIVPVSFSGEAWRITRKGRDAVRGSAAHGRWSPSGEFEVLYTSLEREGAIAEIGYRLSLEPVWPSRLKHEIHRIGAYADRTLKFIDIVSLSPLGVDAAKYEGFDYGATQAIAAAKKWDAPAPFYIEQEAPVPPGGWPKPSRLVVGLPDNHLQYAITWFGLALGLAGVYGVWLAGRLRRG